MANILYGKLNKEIGKLEYTGIDTDTAKITIDQGERTIKIDVKKTPGAITLTEVSGSTIFDGSANKTIDLTKYGFDNDLFSAVAMLGNALYFYDKIGREICHIDISPFKQEQADLAVLESGEETFVKHKETKYLLNNGSNGTDTYVEKTYVDGGLNSKVSKSGDTMTGALNFNATEGKINFNAQGKIYASTNLNLNSYNGGSLSINAQGINMSTSETTGGKVTIDGTDIPKNSTLATSGDLSSKVNKSGDTMTGDLKITTPGTDDSSVATRGYVNTGLSSKANDADVVHKTGSEDIEGNKTFRDITYFGGVGNNIPVRINVSTNSGSVDFSDYDGGWKSLKYSAEVDGIETSCHFYIPKSLQVDMDSYLNGVYFNNLYDSTTSESATAEDVIYAANNFKTVETDVNKIKVYNYYYAEMVSESGEVLVPQITLPALDTDCSILELSSKGIDDELAFVSLASTTTFKEGGISKSLFKDTSGLPISLYKSGLKSEMTTEKYAYDTINFVSGEVERHCLKISLKDLAETFAKEEWQWTGTTANGRLTISSTLLLSKLNVLNVNGMTYQYLKADAQTSPAFTFKGVSNVNLGISNLKSVTGITNKATALSYLATRNNDYVILKLNTVSKSSIDFKLINGPFKTTASSPSKIIGFGGAAKISYMSLYDLVYSKEQADAKFLAASYMDDKTYFLVIDDTLATSSLFSELGWNRLTWANFTDGNDGTVPFDGQTTFTRGRVKIGEESGEPIYENGFTVMSCGKVYWWNGTKVVEPYAPKCGSITIQPGEWVNNAYTINLLTTYGIKVGSFDILTISPDDNSASTYYNCGITRSISAAGTSVTLSAATVPSVAIVINIVYQRGESF